jgi:hypothetical protein
MKLKHPNDQAVAQRLQNFEEGLRRGYYNVDSVEQVLAHIKQLDDEAETRWQAVLKKEAEAKRRAEKTASFLYRYGGNPGEVLWCSDPRYHSTITPPIQHFRVEEVEVRMAFLADAIKALQDSGEACRPSKKPASLAVSELRRAKAVLANILADTTVSEYAKHHLKYSHNRLCKAIHRFEQEGTGNV